LAEYAYVTGLHGGLPEGWSAKWEETRTVFQDQVSETEYGIGKRSNEAHDNG
jgi:hypothetical protein